MIKIITLALTVAIFNGCSSEHSINERNLHKHIEILSSDEFGGRAPGSNGGDKTKDYIKIYSSSMEKFSMNLVV